MGLLPFEKEKLKVNWGSIINAFLVSWLIIDLTMITDAGARDVWYIDINRFTVGRILIFIGVFIVTYLILSAVEMFCLEERIISFINSPIVTVVLACQCFRDWYYAHFSNYVIYYDTASYLDNYAGDILGGKVDAFRTPVYPYFLKLLSSFSEKELDVYPIVVFLQMLISLASVVILYFALKQILKNKYLISAVCLVYGCAPAIISWDLCVLTESLSLASTVLLLFFVLRYLKRPSYTLAITIGLYSFYMLMLRPTFIYLFVLFGVFFVCRYFLSKFDRRQTIAGLIAIAFSGCLTLGYCFMNYNTNGYFGISSVGTNVNQLYIVMQNGYTHNPKYPDVTQYIETEMQYAEGMTNYYGDYYVDIIIPGAAKKFGYAKVEKYVNSCIDLNKAKYNNYTVNKFISEMNTPLASQYSTMKRDWEFSKIDSMLMNLATPYTYLTGFVTVAIALVYVFMVLFKYKRVAWQSLGLSAFIFTHLFVSIYGSMAEYSRLSVMAIPALMILTAYFIDLMLSSAGKTERAVAIGSTSVELFETEYKSDDDDEYIEIEVSDDDDFRIVF